MGVGCRSPAGRRDGQGTPGQCVHRKPSAHRSSCPLPGQRRQRFATGCQAALIDVGLVDTDQPQAVLEPPSRAPPSRQARGRSAGGLAPEAPVFRSPARAVGSAHRLPSLDTDRSPATKGSISDSLTSGCHLRSNLEVACPYRRTTSSSASCGAASPPDAPRNLVNPVVVSWWGVALTRLSNVHMTARTSPPARRRLIIRSARVCLAMRSP